MRKRKLAPYLMLLPYFAAFFAVLDYKVVSFFLVVLEVNRSMKNSYAEKINLNKAVVSEKIEIKVQSYANLRRRQT